METQVVSGATSRKGRGARAAASPASNPLAAGMEPVMAQEPVSATEVAAPQLESKLIGGGTSEGELCSSRDLENLGGEKVAGKEATAVTVRDTAVRERVTVGDIRAQASESEDILTNRRGGACGDDKESVLLQFRDDVAALGTEEAVATLGHSRDAAFEGTFTLGRAESAVPPLAGEEATALRVSSAAAEAEAGPEDKGVGVAGGREGLGDLQYKTAATPAKTIEVTGSFSQSEAGRVVAPLCHSTDATYGFVSDALTASSVADTAAVRPESIVGSGAKMTVQATATTALKENASAPEVVFHEGDSLSGNPLQAAAAAPLKPLNVETEVETEERLLNKWAVESTALQNVNEASWKAAAASYEVDASEAFAEGAGDAVSTSFVDVRQKPLKDVGSGNYGGANKNFNSTYPRDANRAEGARFTESYGADENSSEAKINSTTGNDDGKDGSSDIHLLGNYVRSDCSSSRERGPSNPPRQHSFDPGDMQHVCMSQSFRGSVGDEGVYTNSCSGRLGFTNSSSRNSGGGVVAYGSSSTGPGTLIFDEATTETGFDSSSGIPTATVTDCRALSYQDTSSSNAGYYGNVVHGDSAGTATGTEADPTGETADVCNGVVDATWRVTGDEEEPPADEGELGKEREEEPADVKPAWRAVLGTDDLLTERDSDLLQLLAEEEPSIPDELCRYFLHHVGCVATDRTVTRLVSVATQLQLERVMDDAKIYALCMQRKIDFPEKYVKRKRQNDQRKTTPDDEELFLDGETPDNVEDLDLSSLCAALQKNDDSFTGLNLDCFLDAAPVFLRALSEKSGTAKRAGRAGVSKAAFPATTAELTTDDACMLSGYVAPLEPDGTLPYPCAYQSSFRGMQPMSSTSMPRPHDAGRLKAVLRLEGSRNGAPYAALADDYALQPAASSVISEPYTLVSPSVVPLNCAEATSEVPSVLSADAPFLPSAALLPLADTNPSVEVILEEAPASMSHSDVDGVGYLVNTDAAVDLSSCKEVVNITGALNAAVDLGVDAAAGLAPACIINATPGAECEETANSARCAPGQSTVAGMMSKFSLSTRGALQALPVAASVLPRILEENLSLVGGRVQVAGSSSTDAGAGLLCAPLVDISVGTMGGLVGDSTADGLSAASAPDGSILGAGTPQFVSALNAVTQSPTRVAACVLPSVATNDGAATCAAARAEVAAYMPSSATAPGASDVDIEGALAGASLLSTTFSSASADDASSNSPAMRAAGVFDDELPAVSTADTAPRSSAKPATPPGPLDVPGSARAEHVESTGSALQHSEPTLQSAAAGVWETATTLRRSTAVDEGSGVHQSTGTLADTDVSRES